MLKNTSIKMKILIWFTIALILIEAIMLSVTYIISKSVFNTDIKTQLVDLVTTNVEEIEYYNSLDDKEIETGDQFISYKKGFIEIDDDFCNYINGIYTALFDKNNNLLYGEIPVALSEKQAFNYTTVGSIKINNEKFYVYERQLNGENLDGLWLRGIVSEKDGTNILYTIIKLMSWVLPVLAVFAILGGYYIARKSFEPVEKISAAAEEITSGHDLSKRIDLEFDRAKDELYGLANSFNSMLDRLEDSFQREKQFTSDASHELRTPTSVILAQCEFSLELADSPEEYREALTVIQEQGNKMKQIISQLLFFTRLEQGTEPISMVPVDLSGLTDDICREQSMIGSADISLSSHIEPAITVSGDREMLSRLICNLIGNAYKYGRSGGHITVALKKDSTDKEILLSVSDDGIGIARENLDKIWTRFYQADPSRSSLNQSAGSPEAQGLDGGGIGLGLAMVKEIAHLHGGEVTCKSILGQGSTFTFTLPI